MDLHSTCFSLFNRADGFKVLSSSHGDRFTIGLDVEIRWEAPDTERVKLEVRKGFPQNLTTVHVITQNINNNKWRSRDDAVLRAKGSPSLPVAPLSGCDYVITTRDGQTSARSGYFTIILMFTTTVYRRILSVLMWSRVGVMAAQREVQGRLIPQEEIKAEGLGTPAEDHLTIE
ncbi:conserved hypothetical protein [Coccidioides posadasii str. Silveira]|uniref:Uncharacterized protein n=1 Tax=Coccidioides posadasii (strain RMSCC 757 / Silveira) TaxID=443226 RepID=E9DC85_COCPS|nr:conserved hypothetical protein [Coccidioides posadasii str. Silveira]